MTQNCPRCCVGHNNAMSGTMFSGGIESVQFEFLGGLCVLRGMPYFGSRDGASCALVFYLREATVDKSYLFTSLKLCVLIY